MLLAIACTVCLLTPIPPPAAADLVSTLISAHTAVCTAVRAAQHKHVLHMVYMACTWLVHDLYMTCA